MSLGLLYVFSLRISSHIYYQILNSYQENSQTPKIMKALYKKHQGFEHLTNNTSTLNYTTHLPTNKNLQEVDDTSTKKYPNNKYYQFNDEDSSGRKYLKEKLNLYSDEDEKSGEKGREVEKGRADDGEEGLREQEDKSEQKSYQKINYSLCTSIHEKNKENIKDYGNKKYLIPDKAEQNLEIEKPYHKPKQKKPLTLNKSLNKSCKSTTKYNTKQRTKCKKISASISTFQTKCHTKTNVNSSRHKNEKEDHNQSLSELKHYKKLCLDLRKKNNQLNRQLQESKELNRKSIYELQKKLDKISERYTEKRQNIDNSKTQKIMQSLKAIKGKLNKKQTHQDREEKKFHKFFIESLGILQPEGIDKNYKYSSLEIQIIWKHMLQFLITHDYKVDSVCKIKTIR